MRDTKNINVLLVEDNPGDIELVKESFEEADYDAKLFIAEDGRQALDYLYQNPPFIDAVKPDIILLDLNLPYTNGQGVLEVLKSDAQLKLIPVVVFTSSMSKKDKMSCYDLHANCYVVKPVDVMDFMRTVQSIGRFWSSLVALPKAS